MSRSQIVNEEIIQKLKDCGQYIIDHADEIVTAHKYTTDISVTCKFMNRDYPPQVIVNTEVIPEQFINRYTIRG